MRRHRSGHRRAAAWVGLLAEHPYPPWVRRRLVRHTFRWSTTSRSPRVRRRRAPIEHACATHPCRLRVRSPGGCRAIDWTGRRRRRWRTRLIGQRALQPVPDRIDLDDDDPFDRRVRSRCRLRGWLDGGRLRRCLTCGEVVAALLAEEVGGVVREPAVRTIDHHCG